MEAVCHASHIKLVCLLGLLPLVLQSLCPFRVICVLLVVHLSVLLYFVYCVYPVHCVYCVCTVYFILVELVCACCSRSCARALVSRCDLPVGDGW